MSTSVLGQRSDIQRGASSVGPSKNQVHASTSKSSTRRRVRTKLKGFFSRSIPPSTRPTTPFPPSVAARPEEQQALRENSQEVPVPGKLISKRADGILEGIIEMTTKKIALLDRDVRIIRHMSDIASSVLPSLMVHSFFGTLGSIEQDKKSWTNLLRTLDNHQLVFNQNLALLKIENLDPDSTSPSLGPIKLYSAALEEILAAILKDSRLADWNAPSTGRWEKVKNFSSRYLNAGSEQDQIQWYDRKLSDAMGHLQFALLSYTIDKLVQEMSNRPASNQEKDPAGSGLGISIDIGEAEESDGDEGDTQDNKKRTRRGKRGKNKNKKPKIPAPSSRTDVEASGSADQTLAQYSGSASADYVIVEQPHADKAPIKMKLPLPVTASSSSLVVTSKVLGYGSHGTIVFEGALQGRVVAVKRLLHDFVTLASHEVSLLHQADDHPNIIRYFFSMTRDSFLYIALELCPCSLADLFETPDKHPTIVGSFEPKRALQQVTQGLRHLHNLGIVHRDIKPQNILVSRPNRGGMHRILISDFGLCKKLEVDQTSFLPTATGGQSLFAAGTPGWRAPEILRGDVSLDEDAVTNAGSSSGDDPAPGLSRGKRNSEGIRLTKSVDIFALGCLFYYTIVNGEHPFGESYIREANILKGETKLEGLERFDEEGVEAGKLIKWMLEQDPRSRPDTEAILLHPFFWTPARRLAFLQDASDRFEIMEREPREAGLVALETGAFEVVGADWHKRLDKVFIENLGKYRKYQGASVQDLLRALRNKKHHYQDLPDNVKRHLGPLPDGFLSYFTRRFPDLFLHVHRVISDLPLRHEPIFKSYFELEQ